MIIVEVVTVTGTMTGACRAVAAGGAAGLRGALKMARPRRSARASRAALPPPGVHGFLSLEVTR